MRYKIIILPLVLLVTIGGSILSFGGMATFRDDTPQIVIAVINSIDAIWAWLSGPPLWASCLGLAIMVAAFVLNWIGSARLIKVAEFILKKEARSGEFQKIASDEQLVELRDAYIADRILKEIDWTRFDEMQTFDEWILITPDLDGIGEGGRLREVYDVVDKRETEIRDRLDHIRNIMSQMLGHDVVHILQRPYPIKVPPEDSWKAHERGSFFPDDQTRARWHEAQANTRGANQFLGILKAMLQQTAKNLGDFAPSSSSLPQRLRDIAEGKQP
ncbi:hypothetical protein [Parasphingorhabdus sp. NYA22]